MALTSTRPPASGPLKQNTGARNRRPKQNFETWSWFFMRISGLILVILALFHFALTHIINDVVETDYEFVANRWDNPMWRLYDWSLLALAMLHGLHQLLGVAGALVEPARHRHAMADDQQHARQQELGGRLAKG